MPQDDRNDDPSYLTTKEVAELLRVKERKVYDLAATGEIPHRRITGKLIFPRSELLDWINSDAAPVASARPAVLTGSHDPLLEWAVRESGSGLATMFNGSRAGLDCFTDGQAALTGLHIPGETDWNVDIVSAQGVKNCVLIAWATRARGLVLAPDAADKITCVADLKGKRVARRQPGAGGATFFEEMLKREGIDASDLKLVSGLAHTEHEAAAAVAAGQADAATGIEAMARQFSLGFLPLAEERFDLLIDQHTYFTPPVQTLLQFARTAACHDKAAAMGGYDLGDMGAVRWLPE
ncbi:helix-turn-helix transcriptional regulator [uncultured Aliiroseovarius sp.]|uniref:helix-turn-helix transcriptional regulator n=1 Tax=uncultured Aliiroseovarius sp. TaxID=1658783 RepID=UPI00259939DC|nr:helix-turn-helix transcriptional regulator [uncultured Aliiroseovarius sp.]